MGMTTARVEPGPEPNRLSRAVIGAAIEVHRVPGPGLLESVYEEALRIERAERQAQFVRQPHVDLQYKGHPVDQGRLDLLVGDQLVVELKAVEEIADVHVAQVLSYLRTTGYTLGLLINFNVPRLVDGVRRIVAS